jgi:hypothetical protein
VRVMEEENKKTRMEFNKMVRGFINKEEVA